MAARVTARAARIKENRITPFEVAPESPTTVGCTSDPDRIMWRVVPFGTTPVTAGANARRIKEEPMRFTITLDRDGYRAHLWSGSNLVWWTEGYERKSGALNAIRIAKASHAAPVYDRTSAAA